MDRVFISTKILDVYEEPDDEISIDSGTYDEKYWRERSKEALEAAQYLFELTGSVYTDPELRYNKIAIVIRSRMHAGYNQLSIRKGAGKNVLLRFRYGAKRDEMQELLESNGISFQERRSGFRFQMTTEMIKSKREMLEQIARAEQGMVDPLTRTCGSQSYFRHPILGESVKAVRASPRRRRDSTLPVSIR